MQYMFYCRWLEQNIMGLAPLEKEIESRIT